MNLGAPQKTILVNVVKATLGVAVVEQFKELCRFNIRRCAAFGVWGGWCGHPCLMVDGWRQAEAAVCPLRRALTHLGEHRLCFSSFFHNYLQALVDPQPLTAWP